MYLHDWKLTYTDGWVQKLHLVIAPQVAVAHECEVFILGPIIFDFAVAFSFNRIYFVCNIHKNKRIVLKTKCFGWCQYSNSMKVCQAKKVTFWCFFMPSDLSLLDVNMTIVISRRIFFFYNFVPSSSWGGGIRSTKYISQHSPRLGCLNYNNEAEVT